MDGEPRAAETDGHVRAALQAGDLNLAVTATLRAFGPEVFGFLRGVLGNDADTDEVFAATSVRIWRSLPAFRWQCALRTWIYVIARNEIARFVQSARRHNAGRVTPSALEGVVAAVRTESLSALRSARRSKLQTLRDELPVDDRALLILRVDRSLPWEEIARAFLSDGDSDGPDDLRREAARLRKRFQLLKKRLGERARAEGLLPA